MSATRIALTAALLAGMLALPAGAHAQIGASTDMGNPAPVRVEPLPIPRARSRTPAFAPVVRPTTLAKQADRFSACVAAGDEDHAAGLTSARAWLAGAEDAGDRVRAGQCIGMIEARAGNNGAAEEAFAGAIALVPPTQAAANAGLFGMAGNAALANGHAGQALSWLDRALAASGADNVAAAAVQNDRARALVALNRSDDARQALGEAHRLDPENGEGWLLSATLARRGKDLERAQYEIEQAGRIMPLNPAVGLEAGVIAELSGREASARKSWQSVIAAAPGTPEAATARGYLAQIGSGPVSNAASAAGPVPPVVTSTKASQMGGR